MSDDTKDIRLKRPYKSLEGTSTAFVKMRTEVLYGDWRAAGRASKDGEERTFYLLCRLTGLDESELEQLCMDDYAKLAEMIDMGVEDPKA